MPGLDNDAQLMGRPAAGDPAAFAELLRRHGQAAHAYLARRSGRDDADDLPGDDRDVLLLATWEGFAPAEVAVAPGIPQGTARSRRFRRRVRQRRQLHHRHRGRPACGGHQGSPPDRPHPRRRRQSPLPAAHRHHRPVFAQLFNRLGRHLNYRGQHVSLELHPRAASHNLLKAIRARARRATTTPCGALALAS